MHSGSLAWVKAVELALGGKEALQRILDGGQPSSPGGGGGGAGSPVVHKLRFAHDTPEIANGQAHPIYTPTVGDLLLDAWIDVEQAWDGTTPFADIGQAAFAAIEGGGLFYNTVTNAGVDLAQQSVEDLAGLAVQSSGNSDNPPAPLSAANVHLGTPVLYNFQRFVPSRFNTAEPLLVWVTQDGQPSGAAAGSAAGLAHLYLVTVTPA